VIVGARTRICCARGGASGYSEGLEKPMMYEVVRVGELKLFGEIIGIEKDLVYIQVYEDTNGLRPGETVEPTGQLLSVELGPGLTNNILMAYKDRWNA